MVGSHRARVDELLAEAAATHDALLAAVPPDVSAALPVDAQGITRAIDHLAVAAGFSADERSELVRPHAVNPAVLHARVFGAAPLTTGTVLGAFVEGARVRASALITLACAVDEQDLVGEVRALLIDNPLPAGDGDDNPHESVEALRSAYGAQERAALLIAGRLDTFA
jgi:hypothetical protein